MAAPPAPSAVPIQLGMIGFGVLGRELAAIFGPDTALWRVLTRTGSFGQVPRHVNAVANIEALIAARPAAVIEAAGQTAVEAYVPRLVAAGIPVIIASTGALANPAVAARIEAAHRQSRTPYLTAPGAIGGLDYVASVAGLPDARLRYISRKPPAAWAEELAARGLSADREAVDLFEGTAEAATLLYPRNLNAALTLALACRPAPLSVRIIADPAVTGNVHEIEVESVAGRAQFRFANVPSPDNPKTSRVTALSLAAALRGLLAGSLR
ncbi:aspartate dehydrogenase domain-containing protein [Segnochrobactrum spirostomi]|uniref:L-aspartate dehydrogenase n=1 Tax=Segnochrobactrum spirostomi TaxID=2608987 RepID=A0A6A7YBP0_9HYPH|nr:aspartate dehydrogenase domain-containing protein [Segnochrobactrum spirostomi]MQT15401.1 DUF108 domain-containing protein [Segnochrobactrum spirostomi]